MFDSFIKEKIEKNNELLINRINAFTVPKYQIFKTIMQMFIHFDDMQDYDLGDTEISIDSLFELYDDHDVLRNPYPPSHELISFVNELYQDLTRDTLRFIKIGVLMSINTCININYRFYSMKSGAQRHFETDIENFLKLYLEKRNKRYFSEIITIKIESFRLNETSFNDIMKLTLVDENYEVGYSTSYQSFNFNLYERYFDIKKIKRNDYNVIEFNQQKLKILKLV